MRAILAKSKNNNLYIYIIRLRILNNFSKLYIYIIENSRFDIID